MEDDLTNLIQKYAEKPYRFIEDFFGIKLHWYQKLWLTTHYKFSKHRRL